MSDISDEKSKMTMSLDKRLLSFGLNDIDAKVYLHLLYREPQTILQIATNLEFPRTTIYDSSLRLLDKGLVERIIGYKTQKLKAHPFQVLSRLITKEKSRIDEMTQNLKYLESAIHQAIIPSTATEVRYYHGAQGMMQMMWNSLQAKEETIGYSEFGRVEIVGQKFRKLWFDEANRRNITDRVITNPECLSNIYKPSSVISYFKIEHIRTLEKGKLYISGDTTIYNNVFAVCYWKQGEVVGVEIENPEFVKNQKSIFEILWQVASPTE